MYARQQAIIAKRERLLGRIVPEEPAPNHEDNVSLVDFQIGGRQRQYLDARVNAWLRNVPKKGFVNTQRKLNDEETREWFAMAKRLRQIRFDEEVKRAGSWVGEQFFPVGFW